MVYISGGNELLDPTAILARLGVKRGSRLADLGCGGAGHFIIPAAQLVGDSTIVYAVDIMKSVLRSVTSKATIEGVNNIKPVWSNLEVLNATKIPGQSLDFSLLINILFQSKDDESIIREAVRLLKPGGKLLIIDWNNVPTTIGPGVEDRITPAEIKTIAKKLNLNLIDEFDAGNYHFGLIFTK